MKKKIKIGIYGYGNLGKAVAKLVKSEEFDKEFELTAVFSKRWEAIALTEKIPVLPYEKLKDLKDKIDLLFLCSGSKNECEKDGLNLIKHFDFIDAFDNHSEIKKYYLLLNSLALKEKHTAFISCGWDPGLFSCMRTLFYTITGNSNTVFGKGVSQGHSNAVKDIDGVFDAVSLTVPSLFTERKSFDKNNKKFTATELHTRKCYVSLKSNADKTAVKDKIIAMPDYFEGYKVKVKFCSQKKVEKVRSTLYHKGKVVSSGKIGDAKTELKFGLRTQSNPMLTAKIMLSYARALRRYKKSEKFGAFLPSQIPFRDLLSCNTDFIELT